MEWILTVSDGEFAVVLNGYLPVLALLVIIEVLPEVFWLIATKIERRKLRSDVQKKILTRYFIYQLANIYVTTTAGKAHILIMIILVKIFCITLSHDYQ